MSRLFRMKRRGAFIAGCLLLLASASWPARAQTGDGNPASDARPATPAPSHGAAPLRTPERKPAQAPAPQKGIEGSLNQFGSDVERTFNNLGRDLDRGFHNTFR